jgi:hypothetical protein
MLQGSTTFGAGSRGGGGDLSSKNLLIVTLATRGAPQQVVLPCTTLRVTKGQKQDPDVFGLPDPYPLVRGTDPNPRSGSFPFLINVFERAEIMLAK